MGWHAKRTGGYASSSTEFEDNVLSIYAVLNEVSLLEVDVWSYEAIVGLCCNIVQESGMNPWVYNGSRYGLVQTTFSHYRQYGRDSRYYAPSLGATSTDDGAQPTDGIAQLQMIDSINGTLYSASSGRKQEARDLDWSILEWNNLNAYKVCDDITEAIQAWLLFYEHPASLGDLTTLQHEYEIRSQNANRIIEIIGGHPIPPIPPVPPTPSRVGKMPLYMYTLKRYRQKKGLI